MRLTYRNFFRALVPIVNRISLLLQVYHNYKVLATNFLKNAPRKHCIKSGHRVYH